MEQAVLKPSLDALQVVNSYAELPGAFYTRVKPQPLTAPRLLHVNKDVAAMLGMSDELLRAPEFLEVVSGQRPLPGGDTIATVYSGHQFGIWAGQLGDGRAHLLGEIVSPAGEFEIQLKGSGMTPYSRMGDGRAVLRSSVREYLAGEAMAGLGIPTTRALTLVVSDDPVYRETVETAAIITRVSPGFVRFGSFEHWASQPQHMRELLYYVVRRHYPELLDAANPDDAPALAARLLAEVARRTARLMAQWQVAGFCHGVMNTDNMSILGLTMDYGPYGFMDAFQANHVCNHSDTEGRYAWNAQPAVAHWNLYRLGSALLQLGGEQEPLRNALAGYEHAFLQAYHGLLARKLGLAAFEDGDDKLVDDWWRLLHTQKADFTLSFRTLAGVVADRDAFEARFADREAAHAWVDQYLARIARDGRPDAERVAQMNAANPLYVLRNYLAENAIRAAGRGDSSEIDKLLILLRDPYTERPGYEAYAEGAPEWAGMLEVSCSS